MTDIEGLSVSVDNVAREVGRINFTRWAMADAHQLGAPKFQHSRMLGDLAFTVDEGEPLHDFWQYRVLGFSVVRDMLPVPVIDPPDRTRVNRLIRYVLDNPSPEGHNVMPVVPPSELARKQMLGSAALVDGFARLGVLQQSKGAFFWRRDFRIALALFHGDRSTRMGETLAKHRDQIEEIAAGLVGLWQPRGSSTIYTEIGAMNIHRKIVFNDDPEPGYAHDHFWRRLAVDMARKRKKRH